MFTWSMLAEIHPVTAETCKNMGNTLIAILFFKLPHMVHLYKKRKIHLLDSESYCWLAVFRVGWHWISSATNSSSGNFQGIQLVSNCFHNSLDEPPKYFIINATLQIDFPQDSTYIYRRCLTLFCLTWIPTT